MANPRTTIDGPWERRDGSPSPLGVRWHADDATWNFAIYSKHAETVELRFYCEEALTTPAYCYSFDPIHNKSGPVWHCRIAAALIQEAVYYAYRIDGPAPTEGFQLHQFDGEKLLLDPYARDIFFPPGFEREAAILPGSNEGKAALVMLQPYSCPFDWEQDSVVRHDSDLIIYEAHVRGFTAHENSGIAFAERGTFSAVADKVPYLRQLGITAVELMPVFQFDPQGNDYWGYMPLNVFAPHSGYAVDPGRCAQDVEFRQMVKSLHDADIEVILDVVYNHTCEGNLSGPTYSLKGIDASTYYVLTRDRDSPFANFSGTGNTLHTANRATRRLIVDSLRYWVKEMHVDGFRFDLASIFTRNSDGTINLEDPPIFSEIAADPELADIRLIAEPWDASGAFQLGSKFPGLLWMQWNSAFRDTIQRFVRGDPHMVPELMTRVYGSCDLFPDDRFHALRPFQSVNYITSHDGFTLADLVSFEFKHNEANGCGNLDGHDDYSWNCGWEGTRSAPSHVVEMRKQHARSLFVLLMLSNGTPMFRMGDEFLQTQEGNNNPFNQDNETSWLNWELLEKNHDMFRFFQQVIAFRKRHGSINRSVFWRDDVHWYGTDHAPDLSPESRQVAWCLHGGTVNDDDIYVMANSADQTVRFGIHEGAAGQWLRVIDTSQPSPTDVFAPAEQPVVSAPFYTVRARSVVVLRREVGNPVSSPAVKG